MKLAKRLLAWGLVFSVFFSNYGCSVFRPPTETLNIDCAQKEVQVQVNGQRAQCPSQIETRRNRTVVIEADKEGYETYYRTIESNLNNTAILDIVGGFFLLIPIVGLASPGAYSLDTTDVYIDLQPKKPQKN